MTHFNETCPYCHGKITIYTQLSDGRPFVSVSRHIEVPDISILDAPQIVEIVRTEMRRGPIAAIKLIRTMHPDLSGLLVAKRFYDLYFKPTADDHAYPLPR